MPLGGLPTTIGAGSMRRTFPFSPRSNRALQPGDFWPVRLDDGRYGCGRVLQTEGEELPTKTQAFFGGLHDWVGDVPPTKQDVAKAALVAFGAMHVKAIRKTGGEILGNVPLTESQSEIPELMDSHGGPAARILKGAKFQRAARRDEWGKVPVLSFWGYDVIKLIAESRFANPAA